MAAGPSAVDGALARLIANTKRINRSANILEIAKDISLLRSEYGTLDKVANAIGLSASMLGQFLSVEKLTPKVREMVRDKELDSVSVVHYISKHSPGDQLYLAKAYIAGTLSSQDIRAVAPLRTRFPNERIETLEQRIRKSRNVKVSVIYFPLEDAEHLNVIERRLRDSMTPENFVSLEAKGHLGILKVTKDGEKELREGATRARQTLKAHLEALVNQSRSSKR